MSAGRTILAKRGAKWLADAGVLYLSSLYRDHPTARTLNCCVPFREEQAEAYKLVDEKPKTFVLDSKRRGIGIGLRAYVTNYPAFTAFLASHHQTVGKAALPYFGSRSGWPKRSHRAVRTLL